MYNKIKNNKWMKIENYWHLLILISYVLNKIYYVENKYLLYIKYLFLLYLQTELEEQFKNVLTLKTNNWNSINIENIKKILPIRNLYQCIH